MTFGVKGDKKISFKKWVYSLCIASVAMTACTKDEITETQYESQDNSRINFQVIANMPGEGIKGRAVINEKGGLYWNSGDQLSVFSSIHVPWGYYTTFTAPKEAEGQKKTLFGANESGDYLLDFQLESLAKSEYFFACYPQMPTGSEGTKYTQSRTPIIPKDSTAKRYSIMPRDMVQKGKSYNHLKPYLYMFTNKIMNNNKVVYNKETKTYTLPELEFKHKTALLRFNIQNRRSTSIEVDEVRIETTHLDGNTYSFFTPARRIIMPELKVEDATTGLDAYYTYLRLSTEGENGGGYIINPKENLYAIRSVFPVSTKDVIFSIIVRTKDGKEYRVLDLAGKNIKNQSFEDGKIYTFNLLLDHKLTVESWDDDYIDNIIFGEVKFSVNNDEIFVPLEGGKVSLYVKTTEASGWKIKKQPEWIKSSVNSGGKGNSLIVFTAEDCSAEREDIIEIESGTVIKQVKIKQTASITGTDEINIRNTWMTDPEIVEVKYILQDDEKPEVYFNHDLRSFDTTQPLQTRITDTGEVNVRFYSPRKLDNVDIWAEIPSLGINEKFLLARIESLPPFADYYIKLPFLKKECTFITETGRKITIPADKDFMTGSLKLSATASCDYWNTLQQIKVKWRVGFTYYDMTHTPEYFDKNHRMRPIHCREMVALALNNTYMYSSKQYRDSLFSLQGKLHSDKKGNNIVNTHDLYYNKIMATRTLWVGLTTIAGMAGGSMWTFPESSYLTSYPDDEADLNLHVIWHEFGHILGYNHDGNMTHTKIDAEGKEFGWAMETFKWYLQMGREKKLPIYSRRFLHSRDMKNSQLYVDRHKHPVNAKFSFENDPVLDEIDGGKQWLSDKK